MFTTLLIANRGEIACRIARTARRLGIRVIAVYSDADAGALHARTADRAIRIGAADSRDSYLNIERIIAAARASGAEAIHPGYGFLSESAALAEACLAAGLEFVGPRAAAIRLMGLKDRAKALMQSAGVPVVPGYFGPLQEPAELAAQADAIGYPLLVKAVAGGGGRGMRVVRAAAELPAALDAARGEARRAFGEARVMLERFVEHARHVEVQVIADRHGHCLHLLTRDCSLQRRHQKVIEEAPAPLLSADLRERLHAAAIAAARAVEYENAGTIEFVVDGEEFFFLEMNTRLQVEHPVTEMILGIDLVELQLRVAAGEALPLAQADVHPVGHSFEARIYAEDPRRGFLPAGGELHELRWPPQSAALRIDAAVEAGDRVITDYDALLAKLIVTGRDRAAALANFERALAACCIKGVSTNLGALLALARDPEVSAGRVFTRLIDERGANLLPPYELMAEAAAVLGALQLLTPANVRPVSPWELCDAWTLAGAGAASVRLQRSGAAPVVLACLRQSAGWRIEVNGRVHLVRPETVPPLKQAITAASAWLDERCYEWRSRSSRERLEVWLDGEWWLYERVSAVNDAALSAGDGILRAPMPGIVLAVRVAANDSVVRGQPLVVMEAMKMEHTLTASASGTVADLKVKAGDRVRDGDALLRVAAAPQ